MNDAQFAAYCAYLRDLANLLLLADWEIELDRSAADHGTWAQVTVQDEENFARVYVAWPAFFTRTLEEQREWLVHELMHPTLDRPQRIMAQLASQIAGDATEFARVMHKKEVEVVVQKLARIIAPFMPLPPEGTSE